MKVDVYQNLKNNNTMDNLDKYKGKWCKVNNEEYFLVENLEVDKRRSYGFSILYAKAAFYSRYLYSRKEFELTQRDILEVVDESEVLEQARKYGHKEIVDMLSKKEITKEDLQGHPSKEITSEQILAIKTTESKITSKVDSILQYPNKRSKAKTFQTINLNAIYENSRKSL